MAFFEEKESLLSLCSKTIRERSPVFLNTPEEGSHLQARRRALNRTQKCSQPEIYEKPLKL
jgi:hypothetical protein